MYKDFVVDSNLYHLLNVLFDLDSYKFDKDIIKILNDLKILVDKKMFSNFDFSDCNVQSKEIVIRFLLND